jgi:F0F1-type ATP synthase assembly protein I
MDKKSLRQIIVSSAAYSLSSIIGPLLLFGVPAYFLDRFLDTKPIIMLAAVFIAFITSNILLFKKVIKINQMVSSYIPVEDEDKKDLDTSAKNN